MTDARWLPVHRVESLMALMTELHDSAICIRTRAWHAGDDEIFAEADGQIATLDKMQETLTWLQEHACRQARKEKNREAVHDDV